MTFTNKTGFEGEGKVEKIPIGFKFHTDSSVEGFGSNSEDCDCFDYCECEECYCCNGCDRNTQNCVCNGCYYCNDCDHQIEDCDCIYEHQQTCDDKNCNNDNVCEHCCEIGMDNRSITRNCFATENSYSACERDCSCSCECGNNGYIGECVSDPIRVDQIREYFQRLIEQGYETNSTCGFHQHISFKSNISYMILTDERFYNFYLHEISKWAHEKKLNPDSQFWKRLEGKNHFCKYGFNAEDQIFMREHYESCRYTHLNYCYNVDNRKTLEFRLLPAFTKKELILSGLEKQIEIVEKWLTLNPNKWNLNKIELFARIGDDE